MKHDENYVEKAQKHIEYLYTDKNMGRNNKISTSQIRGLLSGISDIYNDVVRLGTEELTKNIKDRILYLKVQFVYESGRDDKVKNFIEKTGLMDYVDNALKGKTEFIEMAKYMEALVAYHKYYGGEELKK